MDAALRNIADMHLHVGQTSSLDAVPQGKACVGEARRIHDQAIEPLVDSLVDAINRFTLSVGVEDFQLVGVVVSMAPQRSVESAGVVEPYISGSRRPRNVRLAPCNSDLHHCGFRSVCTD